MRIRAVAVQGIGSGWATVLQKHVVLFFQISCLANRLQIKRILGRAQKLAISKRRLANMAQSVWQPLASRKRKRFSHHEIAKQHCSSKKPLPARRCSCKKLVSPANCASKKSHGHHAIAQAKSNCHHEFVQSKSHCHHDIVLDPAACFSFVFYPDAWA